jgi:hypothetical protein
MDGKAVIYTGSTIRSLAERIYKDPHTWRMLARAESTSIDICTITAMPNAEATTGGTLRAAYDQAKRAAEQVVLKRNRMAAGEVIELNKMNAATEENTDLWGELQSVRIGPRMPFKAGVKIGGFAAFELLQVFLMYRDQKLSRYVRAPYLLEDDHGVFTLVEKDRGVFRSNLYWKEYVTGADAGTQVPISKDEFSRLADVAETLWGAVDWAGDFVPGLLQRELPVVHEGPEA